MEPPPKSQLYFVEILKNIAFILEKSLMETPLKWLQLSPENTVLEQYAWNSLFISVSKDKQQRVLWLQSGRLHIAFISGYFHSYCF